VADEQAFIFAAENVPDLSLRSAKRVSKDESRDAAAAGSLHGFPSVRRDDV